MKISLDKTLDKYTAYEKAQIIAQAATELFREELAVRHEMLFPDGRNITTYQSSRDSALALMREAEIPTVEVGEPDRAGNIMLTITGKYGSVICDVRKRSPIVEYCKEGPDCEIEGSSLFAALDTWSALARWCSFGHHKFTDK